MYVKKIIPILLFLIGFGLGFFTSYKLYNNSRPDTSDTKRIENIQSSSDTITRTAQSGLDNNKRIEAGIDKIERGLSNDSNYLDTITNANGRIEDILSEIERNK